jgi:TetR/AcrR family transcriptional repressor of nem operon
MVSVTVVFNHLAKGVIMARPQEFDRRSAVSRAVECFWRKGYSETSLADLLDAMEISRSTFYNSFGDKKQLFELCLQTYSAQMEQVLTMTLLNNKVSPMDSIKQFFYLVMIAPADDLRAKGCLLVNSIAECACADEFFNQLATDLLQPIKLGFVHQLNRVSDEETSKKLAQWLFTQLLGWRLQCQMGIQQAELEQQINHSLQLLHIQFDQPGSGC